MFDSLDIHDLLAERAGGPMKLRLILQPTIATILAVRAGIRDAREGRPPFFWTILTDPGRRRESLKSAWKDVGKVFVIAAILDVAYQIVSKTGVRLMETLIVAAVLALVPYTLLRGPISRIAGRKSKPTPDRAGTRRSP